MVSKKSVKYFACYFSLALVLLQFADVSPYDVGIYHGCGWHKILYPFFHSGWVHLLLNVWIFLSYVFFYKTRWIHLLLAYLVAISFSPDLFADYSQLDTPTIGLSGVIYALLGFAAVRTKEKLYFNSVVLSAIILGFFFPYVNSLIHLYCYLAGQLVSIVAIDDDEC